MCDVPAHVRSSRPSHSCGGEVFLCLKCDHVQVSHLGASDESAI